MKPLVVYYDNSGATTKIANHVAESIEAEERRLVDENEESQRFSDTIAAFLGVTRLKESDLAIEDYDPILILTPAWGGNAIPAIFTFIRNVSLKGKKVIIGLVGGEVEVPESMTRLREAAMLRGAAHIMTAHLRGLAKGDEVAPTDEVLRGEGDRIRRIFEGMVSISENALG